METEKEVEFFWEQNNIFEKSIKGLKDYIFYDGPPFATGLPHYGHLVASTLKDVVPRYWAQNNRRVKRKWGWDCHGLPIEYEIEKELGIKTKAQVLEYGIGNYNEKCRQIVLRYRKQWKKTISRLGRFVDFDNDYKTMDKNYMESLWWIFAQLYKKDLVYRGTKIMPYSMGCGTPLSNFEAGSNYKNVSDPSVYVKFKTTLGDFLVWTTTPWTLTCNLALCVNPKLEYVKIDSPKGIYWLAKSLVDVHFQDYKLLDTKLGTDLSDVFYTPLFNYFATDRTFRVVIDDFVSDSNGTGIVHMAPAFGEDDYRICLKHKIINKDEMPPCPIDANGYFTNEVKEYQGLNVKDADKPILRNLKERNMIFNLKYEVHSYPFCWRSDTPLIYRAVPTWFIAVEKVKDRMVELNKEINWVPAAVGEKRFGNWLENARDWCVSRNRFWGTPIPIWEENGKYQVIESIAELEQKANLAPNSLNDLHRHHVDQIKIGNATRIEEVFDCWFESGAMPYAQVHYPFDISEEAFNKIFPGDFIAEGLDQTRGWFYTLMVLSTALFDKPAFKNVIVNGLVLAKSKSGKAEKMSKSKKNYEPPDLILEKYGADALRLYLLSTPVVRGEAVTFLEKGVKGMQKDVIIMLMNVNNFLLQMIATTETFTKFTPQQKNGNLLDNWILNCGYTLVNKIDQAMNSYKLYQVVPAIIKWVDQLSRWYLKLNKPMLKPWNLNTAEQFQVHLSVLLRCMEITCVAIAPFAPFVTEIMYQNIKTFLDNPVESVHLVQFNKVRNPINHQMEKTMESLIDMVKMSRGIRSKKKIPLKKPVSKMILVNKDTTTLDNLKLLEPWLATELNTMEIEYSSEETKFVSYQLDINMKVVGKRLKHKAHQVKKLVQSYTSEQVLNIISTGESPIPEVKFVELILIKKPNNPDYVVETLNNNILVMKSQDEMTPEMELRYQGKLLVRQIQDARKALGLVPADKLELFYQQVDDPTLISLLQHQSKYIYPLLKQNLKKQSHTENIIKIILKGQEFKISYKKI